MNVLNFAYLANWMKFCTWVLLFKFTCLVRLLVETRFYKKHTEPSLIARTSNLTVHT